MPREARLASSTESNRNSDGQKPERNVLEGYQSACGLKAEAQGAAGTCLGSRTQENSQGLA